LGWVVSLDGERPFEGRQALENAKGASERRLSCIRAEQRAVLRHGYTVRHEGRDVGVLTSGSFSPTLNAGIGMAYLPRALTPPGTPLAIDVRGRAVPATVVKRPFYKGGDRE
jgi:aminomethyltransferase